MNRQSRIIYVGEVRAIAHARGRLVSRGYLRWLDQAVRARVESDCHQLRGGVTLRAADAAASRARR